MSLQVIDVVVVAMGAHVAANITLAHPVQRPLQELLPVCAALDVRAPFLDVRILAVAELSLGKRHEQSGIYGVQKLLGVERYTCDVDSLKVTKFLSEKADAHAQLVKLERLAAYLESNCPNSTIDKKSDLSRAIEFVLVNMRNGLTAESIGQEINQTGLLELDRW